MEGMRDFEEEGLLSLDLEEVGEENWEREALGVRVGVRVGVGLLLGVLLLLGVAMGVPVGVALRPPEALGVGVREALIRRGTVYVYALDFEAMRALPQVTPTDGSKPLTAIHGDVNLTGTINGDNPDNPVVQFIADTE
jgi:hypothetical protein